MSDQITPVRVVVSKSQDVTTTDMLAEFSPELIVTSRVLVNDGSSVKQGKEMFGREIVKLPEVGGRERVKKPFACSLCVKSFPTYCKLKEHMRMHTKEKPFTCTVCCKSFSYKGSLNVHMRHCVYTLVRGLSPALFAKKCVHKKVP